ncbi:MAG: hypothetical protein Q4C83_02420 [Candidatus Saccharibacteria bacterium]|nr:hypothetical protein [Candidatus Saccharibacteria bacterium]
MDKIIIATSTDGCRILKLQFNTRIVEQGMSTETLLAMQLNLTRAANLAAAHTDKVIAYLNTDGILTLEIVGINDSDYLGVALAELDDMLYELFSSTIWCSSNDEIEVDDVKLGLAGDKYESRVRSLLEMIVPANERLLNDGMTQKKLQYCDARQFYAYCRNVMSVDNCRVEFIMSEGDLNPDVKIQSFLESRLVAKMDEDHVGWQISEDTPRQLFPVIENDQSLLPDRLETRYVYVCLKEYSVALHNSIAVANKVLKRSVSPWLDADYYFAYCNGRLISYVSTAAGNYSSTPVFVPLPQILKTQHELLGELIASVKNVGAFLNPDSERNALQATSFTSGYDIKYNRLDCGGEEISSTPEDVLSLVNAIFQIPEKVSMAVYCAVNLPAFVANRYADCCDNDEYLEARARADIAAKLVLS